MHTGKEKQYRVSCMFYTDGISVGTSDGGGVSAGGGVSVMFPVGGTGLSVPSSVVEGTSVVSSSSDGVVFTSSSLGFLYPEP